MAEIKWIKLTTNMFDDEKIKLIDAMPERDTIHYIWIRLLVQCGKTNANGYIFLNENVPYTEEMLSTIFNRPINSIRLALKTLYDFGMIHVQEDKLIRIVNWDKHQNVEGMDKVREQTRKRVAEHRARTKKLKQCEEDNSKVTVIDSSVTVTKQKEKENLEEELEEEVELRDKESLSYTKETDRNEIGENLQDYNKQSMKLVQYFEFATGILGGLNHAALKISIVQHGYENVKSAIDVALEQNKANMTYINGILRNWRNEGYPKKGCDTNVNRRSGNESNKNGFKNFTPKQPKELNDEERSRVQEKLI